MSTAYTAIVIDVPDDNGIVTVTRKSAPGGDGASLRFLQDAVGGYIEHLCEPKGRVDFWFNDEGKIHGLPLNGMATELLGAFWPEWRGCDVLVGNVVLTGNRGPDTASAPDGLWEVLQKMNWLATVVFVDEAAA